MENVVRASPDAGLRAAVLPPKFQLPRRKVYGTRVPQMKRRTPWEARRVATRRETLPGWQREDFLSSPAAVGHVVSALQRGKLISLHSCARPSFGVRFPCAQGFATPRKKPPGGSLCGSALLRCCWGGAGARQDAPCSPLGPPLPSPWPRPQAGWAEGEYGIH